MSEYIKSVRRLLLLEDDALSQEVAQILESPLGLGKTLVCLAFGDDCKGFETLKNTLDSVKKMAAGLYAAEAKSDYVIANYSRYLFSFQQFFHSSYRARQGNVLEEVIRKTLQLTDVSVYEKREHHGILQDNVGINTTSGHDVDVMAFRNDAFLLIQVRSRDDTGGTTAKASLVELLTDFLKQKKKLNFKVYYVIYVWEPLHNNQKASLVNKCLSQLSTVIEIPKSFKEDLYNGNIIELTPGIQLQLVYGTDQFSDTISNFTDNGEITNLFKEKVSLLNNWDDLWLSYAIVSLELENMVMHSNSNFKMLENILSSEGLSFSEEDLKNYNDTSEKYALQILPMWKEDTLPVYSPSDQFNYLRDLILLRMIFFKVNGDCSGILKKIYQRGD